MRALKITVYLAFFSALVVYSVGCEEIECGPGTVLERGECVPLQQANCSGEGVRFENGVCVPDFPSICGPGTELSENGTRCVSTGEWPDIGFDTSDAGMDVTEVSDTTEYEPDCATDLVAGERTCVWGQVFNFVDGSPAPADADPPLIVEIKDALAASLDPGVAPLASTTIEEGGYFTIEAVDWPAMAPLGLVVIAGEQGDDGDGQIWQRSLVAQILLDPSATVFDDLELHIVQRSDVVAWNTALSLTGDDQIEVGGFVLSQAVDVSAGEPGSPLDGVTFSYNNDGGVIRYFGDDSMSTFLDATATETGTSGAALFYQIPELGGCDMIREGYESVEGMQTCVGSANRAATLHFRMFSTN